MKVTVPVLVKDPDVMGLPGVRPIDPYTIRNESIFLDGPVTSRVAVLDFDPVSGALLPGARFVPPARAGGRGRYDVPQDTVSDDPGFLQVAVFGGVCKTLEMFEEDDALGRRIQWAFPGRQLLVVPRAGEWANAFYERDSHSLQFFQFQAGDGRTVYTCQSQDIVAHETAHAAIDGVAPDLYHASLPQGLAIHEAIADVATLIDALRSRQLAARVLEDKQGSIDDSSWFTRIAPGFGREVRQHQHGLRNLSNDLCLAQAGDEPHELSQVLSGALYSTMVHIYKSLLSRSAEELARSGASTQGELANWERTGKRAYNGRERDALASAGKALYIASERLKRTALRALDYLPPGEIGFADFARALLASDQASHPESADQREFLVQEFVRRGIVRDPAELNVRTDFSEPAIHDLDLRALVDSNWLAYKFASEQRKLLGMPADVPFEVRPRLEVSKKYYRSGRDVEFVRECLFKVSWQELEDLDAGSGLPRQRRIARGTTLAIDCATKRVRALVTTSRWTQTERAASDRFVRMLLERDLLRVAQDAFGPEGQPLRGVVQGEVVEGALRLRATARALHLIAWE